ncbi:hypothetical protein [Qipengyuania sp. JC766]|uniref:hypothetical protein n=1 Tax=Qipengyuania sp. JC766 TaxID=3232139 RepID=UPI00345A6DB6
MFRRLIACLVLLTGLAAVNAPAHAAALGSTAQAAAAQECTPGSEEQRCRCRSAKEAGDRKPGERGPCKVRKPIVIYLPTVQLGPDRALE